MKITNQSPHAVCTSPVRTQGIVEPKLRNCRHWEAINEPMPINHIGGQVLFNLTAEKHHAARAFGRPSPHTEQFGQAKQSPAGKHWKCDTLGRKTRFRIGPRSRCSFKRNGRIKLPTTFPSSIQTPSPCITLCNIPP
jgi:hypothetical protein